MEGSDGANSEAYATYHVNFSSVTVWTWWGEDQGEIILVLLVLCYESVQFFILISALSLLNIYQTGLNEITYIPILM